VLARLAALLNEAVVARVGRQRGCRLGLRGALRLVGGVGQAGTCVGSRPGRLSGISAVESDISKDSIRQAKKAFGKQR